MLNFWMQIFERNSDRFSNSLKFARSGNRPLPPHLSSPADHDAAVSVAKDNQLAYSSSKSPLNNNKKDIMGQKNDATVIFKTNGK